MENHLQDIEQKLRDLLNSKAVTEPARKALQRRMEEGQGTNTFFLSIHFTYCRSFAIC
jgi:hypothetical protein